MQVCKGGLGIFTNYYIMGDADTMLGKPSVHDNNFTTQGEILQVRNKKGKPVQGKVLRVNGSFADVLINGKSFLIDINLKVLN